MNSTPSPSPGSLAAMLVKYPILLLVFLSFLPSSSRANMDCIYTSTQKGISIKYTSPCFDSKYQVFIDSFLNNLISKLSRNDSTNEILVLVNSEQLYHDNKSNFANFISVGFDTLREMDQDFIISFFYENYNTSEESRLNPVDVNFTDRKETNKKGIKIVYNYDYRLGSPLWSEIESLVLFSAANLGKIKLMQKFDTVRHYSCYVKLLTIDSFEINQILGKVALGPEKFVAKNPTKKSAKFFLLIIIGIAIILYLMQLFIRKNTAANKNIESNGA